MADEFEWTTEDEIAEINATGGVPGSRRRWPTILLFALVIVTAAFIVWLRQQQQTEREREAAIQQIVAAHELWQEAVAGGDQEIFNRLQSSSDSAWVAHKRRQFSQGVLDDRLSLGLLTSSDVLTVEVELSPGWNSAVLTYQREYIASSAHEAANDVVTLLQFELYRQWGGRWLQSPWDEAFWGPESVYEGQLLTLAFPQRDGAFIARLGQQLDRELMEICWENTEMNAVIDEQCAYGSSQAIRFETDIASLEGDFEDRRLPLRHRQYLLPAPSLIGWPVDDKAYHLLYQHYTQEIKQLFRDQINQPIPFPEQTLYTICFPSGGAAALYRMDDFSGIWSPLPVEGIFRFLLPLPDDSGLILQEDIAPGSPQLRLRLWRQDHQTLILDEMIGQTLGRTAGWAEQQPGARLLLEAGDNTRSNINYLFMELDHCAEDCQTHELDGFTTWSPDGVHSVVERGQHIFIGDAQGIASRQMGAGYAPFWLNNRWFGFVRFRPDVDQTEQEIVVADVNGMLARSLSTSELNQLADVVEPIQSVVRHVALNPADPTQLIVVTSSISGGRGRFDVYELLVDDNGADPPHLVNAKLRLRLNGLPKSQPTYLTPTRYRPFTFSSGGRWLVVTQLANPLTSTWNYHLIDLQSDDIRQIQGTYPLYPARFTYFDWSKDERWLAILEDGYLRLIVPEFDYEQIIPYDQDHCFFLAWQDD